MQAIIRLNWSPSNHPDISSQSILMNGGEIQTVTPDMATAEITVPCGANVQIGIRANGGPSYLPVVVDVFVPEPPVEYSGPSNLSWEVLRYL